VGEYTTRIVIGNPGTMTIIGNTKDQNRSEEKKGKFQQYRCDHIVAALKRQPAETYTNIR